MASSEPEETQQSAEAVDPAMAEGERAEGRPATGLEALLIYLRDARGFDFSGYKRPTLERRIRKRMGEVGIEDCEGYVDYLEANPREFVELFNTILINVTSFFRDQASWDYLQETVLPQMLKEIDRDEPIRVWSAGCASGEEAYTTAIVLLEILGEEEFRQRVKIYATDIDEDALATARSGTYPLKAFEAMAPELVDKYFVENRQGFAFRPDLRRSIIFGRNELLEDAPISRLDLLVCRNVLMYFLPDAQARILAQFNFALRDHGVLFLGRSEMLIRHSDYFTPIETKWRVFKPVARRADREIVRGALLGEDTAEQRHADLRSAAAAAGPIARLIVDSSRFLVDANDRAREIFSLGASDIGRPIQDLELSYRPLELRSPLDRAMEERHPHHAGRVEWGKEPVRVFDVEAAPILARDDSLLGASISFTDVTEFALLRREFDQSKRELETAYEELQSTVEELETTNEELQSTNEELETTNEELQSANEELQTMNEELTSTNDELEAMNDEQQHHALELDKANLFLEGILSNLAVSVVVVDKEGIVQLWNSDSRELWGLRPDEVEGKSFMSLDIGLPLERLQEPLNSALAMTPNTTDLTLEAVNRRGQTFRCEIRTMPLVSEKVGLYGAVVLMRDLDTEPRAPA